MISSEIPPLGKKSSSGRLLRKRSCYGVPSRKVRVVTQDVVKPLLEGITPRGFLKIQMSPLQNQLHSASTRCLSNNHHRRGLLGLPRSPWGTCETSRRQALY